MTPPKHIVRFRVVFGEDVPPRQLENMLPTLESYANNAQFLKEDAPRSFIVETQREGGRKGLSKILSDWERMGFIRWQEITTA